jgi:heat shock protein HslJ
MTRAARGSKPFAGSAFEIALGVMAIAGALVLADCSSRGTTQSQLTIAPDPVDCANGTPGSCIKVTDASGDIWITRPDEIQGFTYEPGFTYQLLVEQPSQASEIQALSPPRLKLIQVLSKQAAGESAKALTGQLDQGEWLLANISPSGHTEAEWAASRITVRFDVAGNRLTGFAGCNDYFASITVSGDQIQVAQPSSTRKACSPPTVMELEQEYLMRIAGATAFTVSNSRLDLTLSDGSGMAFHAPAKTPEAAK